MSNKKAAEHIGDCLMKIAGLCRDLESEIDYDNGHLYKRHHWHDKLREMRKLLLRVKELTESTEPGDDFFVDSPLIV